MITFRESFSKTSHKNGVFLLRSTSDIAVLDFLEPSSVIEKKITKTFQKQKNTLLSFVVESEICEEIFIFIYCDISQDIRVFLWEHVASLPEKLTFFYEEDNILLDAVILWKYIYDEYKEEKNSLEITLVCSKIWEETAKKRIKTLENILCARDIVNTSPSDKTPEKYVSYIKKIPFKKTKVKILDYDDIKKHKLWLLEAVGKASDWKPYMVILEKIVDKKLPTIALVGKGITFDTGWLNIKTEQHMYGMKMDMAGSAAVLYTMRELDEKPLWVNVVAALCIAENSISWNAYRPGDILTSYSGKTVEVTNTDAEGRLVLADGVSYLSQNYELQSITTLATLTGACMVALGYQYAGVMGNNEDFIHGLLNNPTFDKYWRLPINDYFLEKTKGKISDLVNWTDGVLAGSCMGGAFLQQFCTKKELFTHIDLAWPAEQPEKYGLYTPGATWFWVESVSKVIENMYPA